MERIREVEVERDECACLSCAHLPDAFVRCSGEGLFNDRGNVIPRIAKKAGNGRSEVLVELELHATSSRSTKRTSTRRAP